MKFTVAVIVHNTPELADACVESVARQSVSKDTELIVLDNGSDPGCVEAWAAAVKRWRPMLGAARLSCRSANTGFSLAANKLAAMALGEYILFLNSDATIPSDALTRLVAPFEKFPKVAVTGPKGGCRTLVDSGEGVAAQHMDYIEGSCMMVRSSFFAYLGGFDAGYYTFAYCEDADFCLRARQAGYELCDVELAGYAHRRGVTAKRVTDIDVEGHRLLNNLKLRTRWADYFETYTMKRVLVVKRTAGIGDVLQVTAAAELIAKQHPTWVLYADTPYPDLFVGNPTIQPLIGSLREPHDKLNLDMTYEQTPRVHMVEAYARAMGFEGEIRTIPPPRIELTEEEKDRAEEMGSHLTPRGENLVVVHSDGTGWPGRDLPPETVRAVTSDFPAVFAQVGRSRASELCIPDAECDLRGKLDLRELAGLLYCSDAFLGIDSLVSNMAQCFALPSVVAFGGISPRMRAPTSSRVTAMQTKNLACLGCHHWHPPPITHSTCVRSGDRHAPCMTGIEPPDIKAALHKCLESVSR